jgi:hypothetical protein
MGGWERAKPPRSLAGGTPPRILTAMDEFTREGLALDAEPWIAETPIAVLPACGGGRYWTRTSDLIRVKDAL